MNELTGDQIIDLPNNIHSLFKLFPYIKFVIGFDGVVTFRHNGASYTVECDYLGKAVTYIIGLEDGRKFGATNSVHRQRRSFNDFNCTEYDFERYMNVMGENMFEERLSYPMMKYLVGKLRTKCVISEEFSDYNIKDV